MSQADDILAYLKEHPEGITPLQALDLFGCMRLAARVADLRAAGYDIVAHTEAHEGGTHARYRLDGGDRRYTRSMDEYNEWRQSEHYRLNHVRQGYLIGCKWCQRLEEEDSRWELQKHLEKQPQRGFVRSDAENVEYMKSPHARNLHHPAVPGCKWCARHEEALGASDVGNNQEPQPVATPSLWDAA